MKYYDILADVVVATAVYKYKNTWLVSIYKTYKHIKFCTNNKSELLPYQITLHEVCDHMGTHQRQVLPMLDIDQSRLIIGICYMYYILASKCPRNNMRVIIKCSYHKL